MPNLENSPQFCTFAAHFRSVYGQLRYAESKCPLTLNICIMAKRSNVAYALPVDEMRGKLATKQKDIQYSTQVEGAGVASALDGVRDAINFQKYVVLTKRNGKNRFYVKSNTSVKLSTSTRRAQAALGAASLIAIAYIRVNGDNIQEGIDNVLLGYEDYVRRTGDKCGLRGYMCKTMVQQLRLKSQTLTVLGALDTATGLQPVITICRNPFVQMDFSVEPLRQLTVNELAIMRSYMPQLTSDAATYEIAAFDAGGTTYPIYASANTSNIGIWVENIGPLYAADIDNAQLTLGLYNERTNKPAVVGVLSQNGLPVTIDQDSTWPTITAGDQVYVAG